MRDVKLCKGVVVKNRKRFINASQDDIYFAVEGDSGSVVYLDTQQDGAIVQKLLGAVCCVRNVESEILGEHWYYTYEGLPAGTGTSDVHDVRQLFTKSRLSRTKERGLAVPTADLTYILPYNNQFEVVRQGLECDIDLNKHDEGLY